MPTTVTVTNFVRVIVTAQLCGKLAVAVIDVVIQPIEKLLFHVVERNTFLRAAVKSWDKQNKCMLIKAMKLRILNTFTRQL